MSASLIYQKLDARFTGHTFFKYRILLKGPRTDRYVKFVQLRNWCWDTLGSSYERDILIDLAYSDDTFTRKWSWHFEKIGRAHV